MFFSPIPAIPGHLQRPAQWHRFIVGPLPGQKTIQWQGTHLLGEKPGRPGGPGKPASDQPGYLIDEKTNLAWEKTYVWWCFGVRSGEKQGFPCWIISQHSMVISHPVRPIWWWCLTGRSKSSRFTDHPNISQQYELNTWIVIPLVKT